ncbi:putative serine/threonine-protein kinase nek2 [Cucumis melo var. makuwa]|uniref:Putative serine/threonine-protein kinase nek2 n=1 Tax=Cucumis melo var. makuwa TaxID=1194695 RepID=A0A5D3DZX9_CUCMM|nr:putative serine/threonine-protein kinase nek2 [Cucumis melo var. makuwa]
MWKKARVNRQGQYDNNNVQQVDEISMNTDSSSMNRYYSNDVLTQALGTKEHNGRVRGIGEYVTPITYYHSVKKTSKDEVNIVLEIEELRRYAEKVMEKDSSITFPLPADIFGISRKSSILRDDIIALCNMNEVKTFTLVAYMMGHWALLAKNAYEDTVFYLDSLRTTSKETTRYATDITPPPSSSSSPSPTSAAPHSFIYLFFFLSFCVPPSFEANAVTTILTLVGRNFINGGLKHNWSCMGVEKNEGGRTTPLPFKISSVATSPSISPSRQRHLQARIVERRLHVGGTQRRLAPFFRALATTPSSRGVTRRRHSAAVA